MKSRSLSAIVFVLLLWAALPALAQEGPLKVTPKELLDGFNTDPTAAIAKYANQPLEVTGKMTMFDVSYSGGGYIFLDGVKFQCVHEEPWAYALPGQTVKVTATVSEAGVIDFTIVEAQGERPVLTTKDLATQFAKDPQGVTKKYGDRWLELRGKVANKIDDGSCSIVFDGAGKSSVQCFVPPEELKDVEVGQDVRIVAQFATYSGDQPELMMGRVITKPVEPAASVSKEPPSDSTATDDETDSPAARSKPALRTWTSADGKFRAEAELQKVVGATVHLKTKDGREIQVPRAKLSKDDLQFLTRRPR